jgi:hypothetical protein
VTEDATIKEHILYLVYHAIKEQQQEEVTSNLGPYYTFTECSVIENNPQVHQIIQAHKLVIAKMLLQPGAYLPLLLRA